VHVGCLKTAKQICIVEEEYRRGDLSHKDNRKWFIRQVRAKGGQGTSWEKKGY